MPGLIPTPSIFQKSKVFLSEITTWTLVSFKPILCRAEPEMIQSGPESSLLRTAHPHGSFANKESAVAVPPVLSSHSFFQLPLNLVSSSLNISCLNNYTGMGLTFLLLYGCRLGGRTVCTERIKSISNSKLVPRWAVILSGFSFCCFFLLISI